MNLQNKDVFLCPFFMGGNCDMSDKVEQCEGGSCDLWKEIEDSMRNPIKKNIKENLQP